MDKIDIIKKHHYNLCDIAFIATLPHIKKVLITDSQTPKLNIDFSEPEFGPDFGEFDIIIIAEQLENQKLTFISATYDSMGNNDESDDSEDEDESEYENEEEEKSENKEEEISESENEEENKGESEEKSPYNPDAKDPESSSDTLKIVLAVTIPAAVIIIALVVFFIFRWKNKQSSFTKSEIENLVSQTELS